MNVPKLKRANIENISILKEQITGKIPLCPLLPVWSNSITFFRWLPAPLLMAVFCAKFICIWHQDLSLSFTWLFFQAKRSASEFSSGLGLWERAQQIWRFGSGHFQKELQFPLEHPALVIRLNQKWAEDGISLIHLRSLNLDWVTWKSL